MKIELIFNPEIVTGKDENGNIFTIPFASLPNLELEMANKERELLKEDAAKDLAQMESMVTQYDELSIELKAANLIISTIEALPLEASIMSQINEVVDKGRGKVVASGVVDATPVVTENGTPLTPVAADNQPV